MSVGMPYCPAIRPLTVRQHLFHVCCNGTGLHFNCIALTLTGFMSKTNIRYSSSLLTAAKSHSSFVNREEVYVTT